jgi:2-polyprenyl-6-methoxyphenol hydroxylase-like FAD-dependent oxidoreductase
MRAGRLRAVVAGGGIAGLASAVALRRAGWEVTVLERAQVPGEVGAGLAITGNGMTALAALGLDAQVRASGYQTMTAGYQDPAGRWLMRIPDKPSLRAVTTIWGLQRQRLHAILLDAAATSGVELVTGAEVVAVEAGIPAGAPAIVSWHAAGGRADGGSTAGGSTADGSTAGGRADGGRAAGEHAIEADLIVAADGVRSAVRARLFPAVLPRYGGSTSWRAIVSDAGGDGRLVAAWGPGAEFGALRVSDGQMYWYGYFRSPEGTEFADELAAARLRFGSWAPWIHDLVAATPAAGLMRHDVYHLPDGLPSFVSGRVVFTGDAAHAALPTAGQGAALALEDAVCVARMIGAPVLAGDDMTAAMAAFDQARRPRCQRITRTAIAIGRFGVDQPGGWRQKVRNAVLRASPPGPMIKVGKPIVRWTPP